MLESTWYVACATAKLHADPVAVDILDRKLVLFRDSAGKPHALRDRCCHRGFPLSKSRVKDGHLVCGFHGWNYDGGGQCVRIPSQSSDRPVPKSYRVPSYPCEEKDGYVYVWMGEGTPEPVPPIPEFSSQKWFQGSRRVACHFLRALEITFDGAHVYFVHPTHPATMAAQQFGMAEHKAELRLTETGCVVLQPPTESELDPIPADAGTMEFSLPGRIRFAWPTPAGTYYMTFHVVPLDDRHCRIEYLVQNSDPAGPPVIYSEEPSPIMEEDAHVLEAIQLAYEREGEEFERSVEADAPPLLLRRIVGLAMEERWQGLLTDLPRRRIVSAQAPARFG